MKLRLDALMSAAAGLAMAAALATVAGAQALSLPTPGPNDGGAAPWLISIDGDLIGDGSGMPAELLFARNPGARLDDINPRDWFSVLFDEGYATDNFVAFYIAKVLGGERCGETSVLVPAGVISTFEWNGQQQTYADRHCAWPVSCFVGVYSLEGIEPGCFIDFDYYVEPVLEDRFNKELGCAYGGPLYIWVKAPQGLFAFQYYPEINETDHSVREHFVREMWFALLPFGIEARYAGNTGIFLPGVEFIAAVSTCNVRISPMIAGKF